MRRLKDWFETAKIEAIIFDLDNTLIDRQSAMRRYCSQLVKDYCPGDLPGQIDAILAQDNFGYTPRRAWCTWTVKEFPAIKLTSEEFYSRFLDDFPNFFEPDDEVNRLLREIQLLLPTAIATNGGSRTQREKLRQTGIAEIVNDVFVSEEVKSWKPDHALFHAAIEAVDISPARILMVGDDPMRDILPAIELGLRTCWIDWDRVWPMAEVRPEFTIGAIRDFGKLATQ